ncbi:MAG: DUF1015 domain-containing protein [Thermodesulfovibrionia bacterium]
MTSVVAPPYDIVSPELKDELYMRSPYNIIRIDYGRDEEGDDERNNRYTRALGFLNEWIKGHILRQDEEPSFYPYQIIYRLEGEEKTLSGLMAAVKIEEFGKGRIRPHEVTYSKPKSDRLNILRSCMANISPIFSLYSSNEKVTSSIIKEVSNTPPLLEARNGDGFIHRLWRVNDMRSIEMIRNELADKDIFIADGHHRYETALEFKNEMKAGGRRLTTGSEVTDAGGEVTVRVGSMPWNYVLMFLANIEDNGLTLLPTHRMVKLKHTINLKEALSPYFDIDILPINLNEMGGHSNSCGWRGNSCRWRGNSWRRLLRVIEDNGSSIGMFVNGDERLYSLRLKPTVTIDTHEVFSGLGVTTLHELIFKKLLKTEDFEYEMSLPIVIEKVRKGQYHVAFLLTPTRVEDVKRVALAGLRMPPKSTYFYPKLLTGMVIYKFG